MSENSTSALPSLDELRVLRPWQVQEAVGLSKSRIRQLEAAGKFPKRISIGDNSVAWREKEIRKWLADRGEHRQATPQGSAIAAVTPTQRSRANARKGA